MARAIAMRRIAGPAAALLAAGLLAGCAQPDPEVRSAQWEQSALIVGESNPALSN